MNNIKFRVNPTSIHVQAGDPMHGYFLYLQIDRFTGMIIDTNVQSHTPEFVTLRACSIAVHDIDHDEGYPNIDYEYP